MERSPEIEGLMRRMIRMFTASDQESLSALISSEPGRRTIGTDAREWYTGDQDAALVAQLPEVAAAGGMSAEILEVEGFEEGSVGWGAYSVRVRLGQGDPFSMRVSAVFHLERATGSWSRCTAQSLPPTRT